MTNEDYSKKSTLFLKYTFSEDIDFIEEVDLENRMNKSINKILKNSKKKNFYSIGNENCEELKIEDRFLIIKTFSEIVNDFSESTLENKCLSYRSKLYLFLLYIDIMNDLNEEIKTEFNYNLLNDIIFSILNRHSFEDMQDSNLHEYDIVLMKEEYMKFKNYVMDKLEKSDIKFVS